VQQALDALSHEAFLPAPDGLFADAGRAHGLHRAQAFGRGRHDLGAPDIHLRAVTVAEDRPQALAIGRARWTVRRLRQYVSPQARMAGKQWKTQTN
jgi:hypothetical protein